HPDLRRRTDQRAEEPPTGVVPQLHLVERTGRDGQCLSVRGVGGERSRWAPILTHGRHYSSTVGDVGCRRHRDHASRGLECVIRRYSVGGCQVEEALGWASEGWTPTRAQEELRRLRQAKRTGKGPSTMRAEAEANRRAERQRAEEEAAEEFRQKPVADLWDRY